MIRSSRAVVALAGGAESAIDAVGFAGFASMRALSKEEDPARASRPYDKERSGFVVGEGAGVRYEAQLRTAVARIRGTTPNASCLLIGPSDRPMREGGEIVDRPRTHLVVDVQRRVSRDFGCAFFDLVEFGGGPLSMVRWSEHEPPYARGDLVHFTGRAYRRLGEVLHDSLLRGLEPE